MARLLLLYSSVIKVIISGNCLPKVERMSLLCFSPRFLYSFLSFSFFLCSSCTCLLSFPCFLSCEFLLGLVLSISSLLFNSFLFFYHKNGKTSQVMCYILGPTVFCPGDRPRSLDISSCWVLYNFEPWSKLPVLNLAIL